MSIVQVIVGGQYGSEAKGHIAGYLSRPLHNLPVTAIRVAGPNAGHSVVHPDTGVKYALRQIPAAAVTNSDARLIVAPGSEVDITVLSGEIHKLEADGIKIRERLTIDPAATMIEGRHLVVEKSADLTGRIGSTGKGIGAARADRIMRSASTVRQNRIMFSQWATVEQTGPIVRAAQAVDGHLIQVEGTQGYGLGLHTHYYPQVTSSDCTAIDFLAMAGINPWYRPHVRLPRTGLRRDELEIWIVYRPYPIRVAGNSGPMYRETSWQTLGLEPELTTVTQKVRRVGHWDTHLAAMALAANGGPGGPVHLALTMADQIDPGIAGTTEPKLLYGSDLVAEFTRKIEQQLGQRFELVTTSDRTCVDLR